MGCEGIWEDAELEFLPCLGGECLGNQESLSVTSEGARAGQGWRWIQSAPCFHRSLGRSSLFQHSPRLNKSPLPLCPIDLLGISDSGISSRNKGLTGEPS